MYIYHGASGGNQFNVLKKGKVIHHKFFVISTGASCHGASCPWGELSVGRVVMGRVVHGASCPWGELSMGRVVHGASCPWGELSMGRVIHGASCLWGELSMGRDVVGRVLMGQVVRGASCLGASGPGTNHRAKLCDNIYVNVLP